MRNRFLVFHFVLALLMAPATARSDITYPPGTTMEEAWLGPPRVAPAEAVALLSARLLARHPSGSEGELGAEEFEALKFLVGNHEQAVEEAPVQAGFRRYGGEILAENMTAEQGDFFGALSLALARGLGTTALDPPDVCVAERRLWEVLKYKYDLGWNEVEVWGVAAFGHNVQYGMNHSDLVYGVFPFGVRMSWRGAIGCALDQPTNEQELRACGTEKEWKIHGSSWMRLASSYEHVVPGVAQTSLTYAGALYEGQADQFRTNEQTRVATDPTWLLGPSNTPLPSTVAPSDGCVGTSTQCRRGLATDYTYRFARVLAWHPDVVLNASYNQLVPKQREAFVYSGTGDGNPHGLGTWTFTREFSRFHEPLEGCN